MRDIIAAGLADLGLLDRVPGQAPSQLAEYGHLLLEKNQVMNLTAITDPVKVAQLHMLDCAALLTCADFENRALLDVGTGAGFPGLPLKILVPSLQVTLLDSLNISFPVYHQQNVFGCGDISEANGKAACEFWGAVKIFLPHLLCSAVKLCKMHGKGEIHTRLIERQMAVHTHPQQDKIQASSLCYAAADRFAFGL